MILVERSLLMKATRRFRAEAHFLGLLVTNNRVPWLARAVVVLSLLCPIDLIPDTVPFIGYADDLGILWLGSAVARHLTPAAILAGYPVSSPTGTQNVANEIWVLADDRMGHTNQSMGVAEKIGLPVRVHHMRYNEFICLPNLLRGDSLAGLDLESAQKLCGPWPRLLIGTGRRVAPVSRFIKTMSGGQTKIVHILYPEAGRDDFDLVVTPNHDGASSPAPNILRTTGAPNRVTSARLQEQAEIWRRQIGHLPRPWVALLLGGGTRFGGLEHSMAGDLGRRVSRAVEDVGETLLVTTSRRTGEEALAILLDQIKVPAYVHRWSPEAPNPFFGFIALADHVVVTGDSMSMCTEACISGKPVYIYAPAGLASAKHQRLHTELYGMSVARPLGGELAAGWQSRMENPTDEVARAAKTLLAI